MPLDFPTSPSLNQIYTYGSRSWIFNGSAWDVYAIAGNFVNTLNGFTGGITLSAGTGITIQNSLNTITITGSGIGGTSGVSSLTAGYGIILYPPGGTGDVQISSKISVKSAPGSIQYANALVDDLEAIPAFTLDTTTSDLYVPRGLKLSKSTGTTGGIEFVDGTTQYTAGITSLSGTANEIEVTGGDGSYIIGLPNNLTIAGNLNILGYLLVDGVVVTKTGFQGFTGNATQEFVDYVDMDGGEF